MVQLNFNLALYCTILICFPLSLHVIYELLTSLTCDQNGMPMGKNNVSKFSKCERCHKQTKALRCCSTQTLFKGLYNVYTLLLMDNSVANSNMTMLTMYGA